MPRFKRSEAFLFKIYTVLAAGFGIDKHAERIAALGLALEVVAQSFAAAVGFGVNHAALLYAKPLRKRVFCLGLRDDALGLCVLCRTVNMPACIIGLHLAVIGGDRNFHAVGFAAHTFCKTLKAHDLHIADTLGGR